VKGEITIFVSSVQKELADCRRAVKTFIENDPLLRRFFRVFLFEDLPARDRRADAVYLAEVDTCAIYIGLFGNDYGFEDDDGLSPTEREFDRATDQCKTRFIFVKGDNDKRRNPKMQRLIRKAGGQLICRRFKTVHDLKAAVYASLVDYLETCGSVQTRPFDERPCDGAILNDLDVQAVRDFVRIARLERQFPLAAKAPLSDILTHLHLLHQEKPTNAAVLLFGGDPQSFLPCAENRDVGAKGTYDLEKELLDVRENQ
jgi:hypothetical protein